MKPIDQAIEYITTCCGRIGAFAGPRTVHVFLAKAATDMASSAPSLAFPSRYIEHVACATDMVARNGFASSPAAIASLYLVTRFEFYFRVLSGTLNSDGTWKSQQDQRNVFDAVGDNRIMRKRVSSVSLAYKIMKRNASCPFVQCCDRLDEALYAQPTRAVGDSIISNIGDRIGFGRHAVGHGHWGDISSEALFYGLLTAIVFYSQE